jgi:hypothetical protein
VLEPVDLLASALCSEVECSGLVFGGGEACRERAYGAITPSRSSLPFSSSKPVHPHETCVTNRRVTGESRGGGRTAADRW